MRTHMADHGIKKPVFYRTHSFQIFASFVIFSTLLTAIYGFLVFRQIKVLQLTVLKTDIEELAETHTQEELIKKLKLDIEETLVAVYRSTDQLPENLSDQLKNIRLKDHFSFVPHLKNTDRKFSALIIQDPDTSNRTYYIVDDTHFDEKHGKTRRIRKALFKGWLFSVLLSVIIGFFNARRLISPGRRLIEKVLKSNPENLPVDFSKEFKQDEIGVIASALEKSMQRIKAFIEREKQLTRDASHELRTPVTVIKGAVELMEELPEIKNAALKRLTDRIDRSVRDMEVLIEVLLVRAREEETLKETATCQVKDVAKQVVEESRYLIGEKPVELKFHAPASPIINASAPELKMTLSNLVRNAINYTHQGYVTVTVRESQIEINDTGIGIDAGIIDTITSPYVKGKSSQGYGIGLSIVSRICSKYGWQLRIQSVRNNTSFKIVFNN